MEPTAADVNAVAQSLGQQPAPQPAAPAPQPTYTPGVAPAPEPAPQPTPAPQQQPTEPVSQPAPTSQPQDPFSQMFAQDPAPQPQPTQPTEPVTTPQPQQPTEPTQPTTTEPAPQAPVQQPTEQYQSFEDYMASITEGLPDPQVATPDPTKIDPNDTEGIKNFFDDLVNTAVQKASAQTERTQAIQNSERALWDDAMDKYGSLRTNKNLRDTVHAIRMTEFRKGVAITPTQAAEKLLGMMNAKYNEGIAANQVVTTIQDVQPNGGGGQPVPTTTEQTNVYQAIQQGGETALAEYLDGQIKAGKM